MESKKQTVVEWLAEQLKIDKNPIVYSILDQAKEIEKQQIIKAFNLLKENEIKQQFLLRAEQYYNETFNK